jgi:hypothetical protein
MALRMQDQYGDFLKNWFLSKDKNLNVRSVFETGAKISTPDYRVIASSCNGRLTENK